MGNSTGSLGNQHGMILVISVLILSLLMTAGIGAIVSMQTDFKISGNLKNGTQALYLAEAGIEWGKDQIKRNVLHPPNPTGATQELSTGNFSVFFLSPTKLSLDSSSVTIRSTGVQKGASNVIQVLITKTYQLSDGAVGLRGNEGHARFLGRSFSVDGRDYDPVNETLVPGAQARPAISVPSEALKGQVVQGLNSEQHENLIGKGGNTPSIEESGFLSSAALAQLADDLCRAPQAIVTQISSEGTFRVANLTWGNRGSPQLRCVDGLPSEGDSLTIEGHLTGVGIVVVRHAEMVVQGPFRWEGLVLVSGNRVGFRIEQGEGTEIYGSVLINERGQTSGPGTERLKLQGEVKLRYSSAALKSVTHLIPQAAMENLYSFLPSDITQNYWRIVNP